MPSQEFRKHLLLLLAACTFAVPTTATGYGPCAGTVCPKGTICNVFQPTGEPFCNPSCDVDNGGCDDDQRCILAIPLCANPPLQPCVNFVTCVDKDPCEYYECPTGSSCEVFEPTKEAFCQPSCKLDNGGCPSNLTCRLEQVICVRAPCPPVAICEDPSSCPPDNPPVNCFVDPCLSARCPQHPNATCRANFCGGCNAEFFDEDGNEVTDTCTDCSAVLCLKPDCDNPIPPPPGECCATCPIDCRVVKCAKPPCLNPLPANPDFGICCPRCPDIDCSVVLCAAPDCLNPIPADIKNGICCPRCPIVDCRLVFCLAPDCPNPIPPDPDNGKCCQTCPDVCPPDKPAVSCFVDPCLFASCPGNPTAKCRPNFCGGCFAEFFDENGNDVTDSCTECLLIDGQSFDPCGSGCPLTCDNRDITCDPQCVPGCHCPKGQFIDTVGRTCFTLDECPDVNICQLPADTGPCKGAFPRFFFNTKTKECEKFTYGGCKGNKNNFQTLEECQTACDSNVQCKELQCPPLTCPDPIPADPDNGVCCGSCPKDSTCPVKGQIYAQCKKCPVTCADHGELIFCPAICKPGCECPGSQVIDTETNSCVEPEECTPTCQLRPDTGPCEALITRYFYNPATKQCETFTYGGCDGNDNNFQSLAECELKCSECAPTCTSEYCTDNPKARCSFPPGTPRPIPGCFGGCDETICGACYNSTTDLALPKLKKKCPTLCPVDANGTIATSCLHTWGKCVHKACRKQYPKAVHDIENSENLRCWRPACPLKG